jgi:membrane dipeptidase
VVCCVMRKNKAYNGYRSFQYLESGKDYRVYELVKQVGRVDSHIIELSKGEQERFEGILEKYIVISLHDHTVLYPDDPDLIQDYMRSGRTFVGYEGLAASGVDAVFEALYDGVGSIESKDPWAWENIVYQVGMFLSDVDHQDFVFLARRAEDVVRAHADGKVAIVFHMESIPDVGSNLDKIDVLYGLGVRCMGLAYSQGNVFCSGLAEKHDRGVTDLGYEAIERMDKLGLTLDLAHVSDKSRLEAIEACEKPVFITHAGARALWASRRMVADEALHALAEKDGVIGVEAAPHTTLTMKQRRHSIESIMEHFEYIADLIGVEHVAFGPDTLFGDHVGLHKIFARELATSAAREDLPEFEEVAFVDGLENPSEFHNIIRWLIVHGYSDGEIGKVAGANIIRVIKKTWQTKCSE